MEKVKRTLSWIIGILFIITFFVYADQIVIPSILILIAGIILLPPINQKIKNKFNDEEKIKNYEIIRNVLIIIFILVLGVNLPEQEKNENQTNNYITNNNIINTINQTEINKSVTLAITETNGKYTGERIDGKKEGSGKYEWNDGTIYEGQFLNDEINGQGKLTIPQQGTYEGTFVNGKRSGQGTYTFANGDIYQGNWENDKMSGQGTYTFVNGDTYVGEFSENKFNGQGTYTKDGNKYTGTWSDNEYKK